MSSAALFHREYEAELEELLQRRFGYLCIAFATVEVLFVLWALLWLVVEYNEVGAPMGAYWISLTSSLAGLGLVSLFLVDRMRRTGNREAILRAATWLILALGGLTLVEAFSVRVLYDDESPWIIGRFFLWHIIACSILPWQPRESLRPMIPLLAIWALDQLYISSGSFAQAGIRVMLSPLILLPGFAVTAIRMHLHGRRFQNEMLGRQFVRMRRELTQARSLHESMFPRPLHDGYVRFEYSYSPARDVGGDFIHYHVGPTGIVSVTVIDVTGHGIAAALTVNRLSGELDRLRAEHPDISPAKLLTQLNRYVHLTLSRHSVYATAVAFDVDPHVCTVRFASAGHPPLLVRRADGTVLELDVSGMMLGAVGDDLFEIEEHESPLGIGDVVLAYTDGAFECTNRKGEQLGLERLLDFLRSKTGVSSWPPQLAGLVERHHSGRAQDDVLITAVSLERRRGVATATTMMMMPTASAPRGLAIPDVQAESPTRHSGKVPAAAGTAAARESKTVAEGSSGVR